MPLSLPTSAFARPYIDQGLVSLWLDIHFGGTTTSDRWRLNACCIVRSINRAGR